MRSSIQGPAIQSAATSTINLGMKDRVISLIWVAASVAHLMITYALRMAPAATLAPLHYLELVSAAAFGYLVFGDFPNALTWTGIGIIVLSGLYVIHRERLTARQQATRAIARGSKAP